MARLESRMSAAEPWWDSQRDCLWALRASRIGALDLGTGGRERLSELIHALSERPGARPRITASEGWAPNLPITRDRAHP